MESWLSREEYVNYIQEFDTSALRKLADKIDRRKRLLEEARGDA